MPLIVDPLAPPIVPPGEVVSADGWLTAVVDPAHAGVMLGVDYTAGTPLAGAADVRKVRITRTDPGAADPLPVRSADPAWAIEGVGVAYDHGAPLGVAVVYTAVPEYEDGSTGPASSVSITLADPVTPLDVWIKSIDEPGLSALVTVLDWPTLTWAARVDRADIEDNPYPATAQSVYGASASDITISAQGDAIEALRTLLTTPGVRLIQTRSDYHRPDQHVLFGDVSEAVETTPNGARIFTASLTEVARPGTAGQPLRVPGWSYDILATAFASYDEVASTYGSYASLATDGVVG